MAREPRHSAGASCLLPIICGRAVVAFSRTVAYVDEYIEQLLRKRPGDYRADAYQIDTELDLYARVIDAEFSMASRSWCTPLLDYSTQLLMKRTSCGGLGRRDEQLGARNFGRIVCDRGERLCDPIGAVLRGVLV